MHRGGGVEEELLAISPPPEFQDSPAPPPAVFRDSSPSPAGAEGLTSCRQGKTTVSIQPVWEFADRISFDILNEAMVIATEEVVLSSSRHGGGGSNRGTSVAAPFAAPFFLAEFPISSDFSDSSDESNPVSTTTSWEYLSKASSWSDIRYPGSALDQHQNQSHLNTSPLHHIQRRSRSRKSSNRNNNNNRECTSSTSSNHNPVSFPKGNFSAHHSQYQQSSVTRSASFHMEPLALNVEFTPHNQISRKNTLQNKYTESFEGKGSSLKSELEGDSICYNVPFQSDLYSLPVDTIVSQPGNQNRPIAAPRKSRIRGTGGAGSSRSNCKGSSPMSTKVSESTNQLRSENQALGEQIKNSRLSEEAGRYHPIRHKLTVKPTISLDSNHPSRLYRHSHSAAGTGDEHNNNIDQSQHDTSTGTGDLRKGTRRSRSVEMSISVNTSRAHQDISSQNSTFSKDSTTALEMHDSGHGKPEKRTLGHSILNLFKRNKPRTKFDNPATSQHSTQLDRNIENATSLVSKVSRALPPTPADPVDMISESEELPNVLTFPTGHEEVLSESRDFAASIEKVKDCGWYWGPLSSEAAEDLLRGEPDGSFIVRDSSDAHYIFSLTFKLNGLVRHVRIEHDQGNFSFGPLARFKASTIVDFVENAVAHSRSGRYLFFLHRRPVLGPMRVQLLHPYSRFRHPRSLQHMCRFVILKYVRRDLIHTLPLPKPLQDYLNTPHYYFELQDDKKKHP